jgi:cytochrome P450
MSEVNTLPDLAMLDTFKPYQPSARAAIVFILLVILLTSACIQAFLRHRQARRFIKLHGCQPPPLENPYDPLGLKKILVSTLTFLDKESLNSIVRLFNKHGNTYTTRVVTSEVIFTCDPQNIRQILATGFTDFESSPLRGHLFKPLLTHSIFQVDGPHWKSTREKYRHEARFSSLRSILDLTRQEKSIQHLLNRIPDNKPFDLYMLFRHLMMDLTTGFCLGDSAGSLTVHQTHEKKEFAEAITDIQQHIATGGFVGPLVLLMSQKQMRYDTKIIHRFVEKYIDDVLSKPVSYDKTDSESSETKGYNILSSLAEHSRDKLELRDYVTTILIAGTESSSSLLSSVMYLLARNEHVFVKLRQSVLEIVGREVPTFAQLKALAYLRCVINEG